MNMMISPLESLKLEHPSMTVLRVGIARQDCSYEPEPTNLLAGCCMFPPVQA